jgi:hypothetical protein
MNAMIYLNRKRKKSLEHLERIAHLRLHRLKSTIGATATATPTIAQLCRRASGVSPKTRA